MYMYMCTVCICTCIMLLIHVCIFLGDKMGCGIDYDTDVGFNYVRIFFTKNGKQIGQPQKMKRPVHGLYPMFGKMNKNMCTCTCDISKNLLYTMRTIIMRTG